MIIILNIVIAFVHIIKRAHEKLFPKCKVVAKDIATFDCIFNQTSVSHDGTAVLEIHVGWWIAGHKMCVKMGHLKASECVTAGICIYCKLSIF